MALANEMNDQTHEVNGMGCETKHNNIKNFKMGIAVLCWVDSGTLFLSLQFYTNGKSSGFTDTIIVCNICVHHIYNRRFVRAFTHLTMCGCRKKYTSLHICRKMPSCTVGFVEATCRMYCHRNTIHIILSGLNFILGNLHGNIYLVSCGVNNCQTCWELLRIAVCWK